MQNWQLSTNRILRCFSVLFLLLIIGPHIYGQVMTITGTVTDENGGTLPGVTVVVKGQAGGNTTDANGNYSIQVQSQNSILVFSFVGMKTTEVTVGNNPQINVTLENSLNQLDEVVVVGYGTLQRREITNSVASVKADAFVKGSVKSVGELIQGKVAGLLITKTNASPTASPEIILRGVGTLKSGVSPLVIIDGIPGDWNQVAPEDVESIDVLKDGSAAAIYGTRGSNGVVLITTKKVRGYTPTTVEFSTYVTTERITRRLEFLNSDDIRTMADEGNVYAVDEGYNTDWQELIYQNPISENYNLSVMGGDQNTSYYANLNYKEIDGLIKRSDNNIFKARLEINNSMLNNRLRFNANFLGSSQKYYPGNWQSVYEQAITRNPTDRPADDNGKWVEYPARNQYENPMAHLYELNGETVNTMLKGVGSVQYEIIPGLFLKGTASIEDYNSLIGNAYTLNHINNVKNGEGGSASLYTSKARTDVFESTLNYKIEVAEDHKVNLLLGHSWQELNFQSFQAYNHKFPTDYYDWYNLGAGQGIKLGTATMASYKEASKLIGFFLRGNYNYKDRYLLMGSIRREGSSKFGENYKWGWFPAISAGWNIMNESFMENITMLSSLRLRTGYGLTGTIPETPYNALRKLTYDTSGYVFSNGKWIAGLNTTSNPNPYLRWENKAEYNLGVDFGIWKDRLTGSIDLYYRKTTDIIWDYAVPSPPNLYTSVVANAGSMENKGLELFVSGQPVKVGKWVWTSSANYSTNKNKLLSLSNEEFQNNNPYINAGDAGRAIREYTHKLEEGGPIGNFYGYKSVGIDANGMWLVETADGPKTLLNAVEADKQVLGNGLPKHYLNWNNAFKYGNFDLEITMRGAFDYQILNQAQLLHGVPSEFRRSNVLANSFTHEVFSQLSMDQNATYVSHFLEDGDYWKIDNITLGYNWLPGEKVKGIGMCRVYASLGNFLTFTNYSGIDPEVTTTNLSARAPGIDYVKRYPATRSFTAGLVIQFR
jgi:TonB-dependent starch-binding outer membrane protein SusC